jgi:hypothetical protein
MGGRSLLDIANFFLIGTHARENLQLDVADRLFRLFFFTLRAANAFDWIEIPIHPTTPKGPNRESSGRH